MLRGVLPALFKRDGADKNLLALLTASVGAIGLCYGAGLFYGERTHLSVMEYWRWWVVHLWVEGFFEVFATTALAFIFSTLGLVSVRMATTAGFEAAVQAFDECRRLEPAFGRCHSGWGHATSALDSKTEKAIQAQIERAAEGRTALVIAHRLSTIMDADEIIVLDGGRIMERGRHAALLAQGGTYAQMWMLQQQEEQGANEAAT